MRSFDDAALTEVGADFSPGAVNERAGRALVIGCGALAREILAVLRSAGLDKVDLRCLPAKLHNAPQQIPDAARRAIEAARADGYERISLAYADCGTGGLLDRLCEELDVVRMSGPHCYAFYDGQSAFAARADAEIGAFYLTDFLARQFDAVVWRGLGLDRFPDLLEDYFGHYDRVVYLAQTDDPALDSAAQEAAARLGLAYERRFTGYGELTGFLVNVSQERGA
ncbi:MAG: DUF1638 domain-containing protein [Neomegalonema sp.]|nr:DUF1638 domain-containing protein [Neomegalonema sp.]